jgi:hypothetical protein
MVDANFILTAYTKYHTIYNIYQQGRSKVDDACGDGNTVPPAGPI